MTPKQYDNWYWNPWIDWPATIALILIIILAIIKAI